MSDKKVTPKMVHAASQWLVSLHHMRSGDRLSAIEQAILAALEAAPPTTVSSAQLEDSHHRGYVEGLRDANASIAAEREGGAAPGYESIPAATYAEGFSTGLHEGLKAPCDSCGWVRGDASKGDAK